MNTHFPPPSASAVTLLTAEKSICGLRLNLIEMFRISLHAVDNATKAYALGLVEFARWASSGRKKQEYLKQKIIAATQELYKAEEVDDLQTGFVESARAISAALSSICQQAYEISSHEVEHLHGRKHHDSKALVQLAERVNGLLRLCIVAFVKQNVEYAEAVLRDIEEWNRETKEPSLGPEYSGSAKIASDMHGWTITASLSQIMEDLSTIAVALLSPCPFGIELSPYSMSEPAATLYESLTMNHCD